MSGIDVYMQEIEAFALEAETKDTPIPFEAAEAADILSTMLIAFPHLFEPGSDLWSEEAEAEDPTSVTLALPAVWQNFPDFYRRANETSQAAFDLSRQQPRDARWIDNAKNLREACESCHADYTRLPDASELEPPLPVPN
jgi:cytochrome c556